MLKLRDIKRSLYRRDEEISEIFTLAIYVMAYCMQVGAFVGLLAVFIVVLILFGSDLLDIAFYASLAFVVVSFGTFIISLWFLRVALDMGEQSKPARRRDGRFRSASSNGLTVSRIIPVNDRGKKMYMVGEEMLSREELIQRTK